LTFGIAAVAVFLTIAAAVTLVAAALVSLLVDVIKLSDRNGDGLWDFFLDRLHLGDHSHCSPLNMLEHVLQLGLLVSAVDHDDGGFSPGYFAHLSLVVIQSLLNDLGHGLSVGHLFHDDLSHVLLFMLNDGLLFTDELLLVLDHLAEHLLLPQSQSLDYLLFGFEHLLPADHFLYLPFSDCSRAVLVLLIYVAVLVTMLDSVVLGFASGGACSEAAAGLLRDSGPVVSGLVSATPTTSGRLAASLAVALDGLISLRAFLEHMGGGLGPVTPSIEVLRTNAASEIITICKAEFFH